MVGNSPNIPTVFSKKWEDSKKELHHEIFEKIIFWLFYVHGIELNNQITQKVILHKPKLKPSNV